MIGKKCTNKYNKLYFFHISFKLVKSYFIISIHSTPDALFTHIGQLIIKRLHKYGFVAVAHDIGTVTLQVVIDGRPVSTTAIFEYRQHEFPLTISSLSMPHTPSLLKFHLLQKLDTLEDYLQPNSQQADHPLVCIICTY